MNIDTNAELAAVQREVSGTDVRLTRRYAEAPVEVWSALTTAERIERWLAPVTGELTVGGRYQVEGNAGGEITALRPPHSFAATWEFGGHVGRIVITLSPTEDRGTALELVHHLPSPPRPLAGVRPRRGGHRLGAGPDGARPCTWRIPPPPGPPRTSCPTSPA